MPIDNDVKSFIIKVASSNPEYQHSPVHVKTELAKNFIRKKLCRQCRVGVLSSLNNEFRNYNYVLCSRCEDAIYKGIERASNPRLVPRWIIECNAQIRRDLLDEMRSKTGKEPHDYLSYLHKRKHMTAPAIKEFLYDKHQITINIRVLTRIMRSMGILDTHVESLQKRVVTGRMDYSHRNIDYDNRDINYDLRTQRKRMGIPAKNKFMLIRADARTRQQIAELSKRYKRTKSETIRALLGAMEGVSLPDSHFTLGDKLRYAIDHKAGCLRSAKTRGMRGVKVILTKRINE